MLAPLNFLKTLPFMAAHAFIPLSPNIHIQILQTDLYIYFLKDELREFDKRSKNFLLGDHFIKFS